MLTFHVWQWHHLNTLHLCKYNIMQKLTFLMWCVRQSSYHIHCRWIYNTKKTLQSIKKCIYIHSDDFVFTVFDKTKCYWSIYQSSACESEFSFAWHSLCVLVLCMFVLFTYTAGEYCSMWSSHHATLNTDKNSNFSNVSN